MYFIDQSLNHLLCLGPYSEEILSKHHPSENLPVSWNGQVPSGGEHFLEILTVTTIFFYISRIKIELRKKCVSIVKKLFQ